jgi:ribonuclease HI
MEKKMFFNNKRIFRDRQAEEGVSESVFAGQVVVYTDGSCLGNPGTGGWGVVVLADGSERRFSDGEKMTTNNRMELTAAIKALEIVRADPELKTRPVRVHIDSEYVKKGITEWINKWKKNNWRTSEKQPVKNKDLWLTLDALNKELDVSWSWVRGHDGNAYNEICDYLARTASERVGRLP